MDVFLTPTILSIGFISLDPNLLSISRFSNKHSMSTRLSIPPNTFGLSLSHVIGRSGMSSTN